MMTCQSLRNPVEPSSELRDTGSALVVVFTSTLPTQPPSPHQQTLLTRLIATDPGCYEETWRPCRSAGKDRPRGAASETGFPLKGRQPVPRGRGERKGDGGTPPGCGPHSQRLPGNSKSANFFLKHVILSTKNRNDFFLTIENSLSLIIWNL